MRKSIVYTLIACLLVSSIPFSVTADATDDIPTNAAATGIHDSLVAALTQADLVTTLQGDGPFTVFAPTDQAFIDAGIDLTTFDTDEENATLVDILTYHVVSGKVMSTDLTDGMEAAALNQDTLTFSVSATEVKVNDAVVTTADVESSNGVIHVIDKVLMPPADLVDIPATAQSTGVHTALVAALAQVNLVATLQGTGPFTVFAPTDQAFTDAGIDLTTFDTDEENATLVDILTYHVVSGTVVSSDLTDGMTAAALNQDTLTFSVSATEVKVNDAVVTTADVATSNGVIHVIDKVLMPPTVLVDIPTTADSTGIHTALVAALAQANLVATLQGTGPFTVFAPTDQAFADAGIDLTTFDTDEENATLVDILTYHVVSGTVMSSDLTDGMEASALNQDTLTFSVSATEVKVNDAVVTAADVATSNGVIHVIDKVLMPPADEAPDPFEGIDCAVTIGLTADGYGFNPSITSINVGQTVCWSWTDAVMGHNVKQVDGALSSTFVANGITSGAAATTVAFHHTFTENQTFYYACEPHISMNMFGEIVVGDGGVEPTSDADDDENTPGFMASTMILAALGAILFMGRRRSL
tara:strand:- start:1120 stop:2874 length:1755 start_codon:yes stop_codon:yes gene_type:complete